MIRIRGTPSGTSAHHGASGAGGATVEAHPPCPLLFRAFSCFSSSASYLASFPSLSLPEPHVQIFARHLFAELLGRFFCWGIALDIVTSVAPSSTFSVPGSWGQTATMRGPRCFFCVAQLSAPMEGQFENKFKHFQTMVVVDAFQWLWMLVMRMHMCPAQPRMREDMDVLDVLHDNAFSAIATAAGATSAGATSGTGTKQENHYCTVQTPCMRMRVTVVQTCPRVIMAAQPHSLVAEHVSFLEEQDRRPQA